MIYLTRWICQHIVLKMEVPGFSSGPGDIRDFLGISEDAFASNCRGKRETGKTRL